MNRRDFLASSVTSLLTAGCLRTTQEEASSDPGQTGVNPPPNGPTSGSGSDVNTMDPEGAGASTSSTETTPSTRATQSSSTAQSNDKPKREVNLEKAWESSGFAGNVVSSGGSFFVTTGRTLTKIRPRDGKTEWSASIPDTGGSGPIELTVSDSAVFVGTAAIPNQNTGSGNLFAFDPTDGALRWSFETTYEIIDDITPVADDLVVIGNDNFYSSDTHEQIVYGIDQRSGDQRWKITDLPGGFISAIAAGENRVYVETAEPERGIDMLIHDTGSGTRLSDPAVTAISNGGLLLHGDILYLYEKSGLSAFELPNWDRQWRVRLPYSARSSPVLEDDVVYVGTEKGTIAIDTVAGEQSWEAITLSSILRDPIVGDEFVWAIDTEGTVWACDKQTGKTTAFAPSRSDENRRRSFALVDDVLLVSGNPGIGYRIQTNRATG